MAAIAGRKIIPSNGTITVMEVVARGRDLWYRVEARSGGRRVGVGLLNSAALIGQDIRVEGAPK
jgi:hypothetical protein